MLFLPVLPPSMAFTAQPPATPVSSVLVAPLEPSGGFGAHADIEAGRNLEAASCGATLTGGSDAEAVGSESSFSPGGKVK